MLAVAASMADCASITWELAAAIAGLRRNHLGARRGQRRLGALQGRPVIVELLLRQGIALDQRLGAGEALLRRCQLGLALRHHGLGGGLLAVPLGHQGGRGELGVLRLPHLGLGLGQLGLEHLGIHPRDDLAGLHEVALVDQDLRHPPGELGRDVHLGGLDAPVAAGESLAQAGRSRYVCQASAPAEHGRHQHRETAGAPAFCVSCHPISPCPGARIRANHEGMFGDRRHMGFDSGQARRGNFLCALHGGTFRPALRRVAAAGKRKRLRCADELRSCRRPWIADLRAGR